jgi:hypothetical protein
VGVEVDDHGLALYHEIAGHGTWSQQMTKKKRRLLSRYSSIDF